MEAHARSVQAGGRASASAGKAVDPNIRSLEDELTRNLGLPVQVKTRSGGGGELRVRFSRPDELDGVIRRLRMRP